MLRNLVKKIFNPGKPSGGNVRSQFGGVSTTKKTTSRQILGAFGDIPWVYGPFGKLSQDFAEAPFTMYRAPGGRGPIPRSCLKGPPKIRRKAVSQALHRNDLVEVPHYLLDVLEDGNPYLDGVEALQTLCLTYLLDGEMVAVFERNDDGQIQWIYPIPTFWLVDLPRPGKPFYSINFPDEAMDVPEEDVLFNKVPNPAAPYGRGVGAGQALAEDFEADDMARKHIVSYFKNNSTPSLLIGVENATQKQLDRAREKWERNNRGVLRGFATHFYSGKLSAQQLSRTFRENQTIDLRDANQDTVMQTIGMPPEIQGKIEDANTSTIESAEYLYTKRALTPIITRFRSEFQNIVDREEFRNYLFDCYSVVPEDKEHKLSVFRGAPQAFTENEWRSEAGYAPLDDGDKRYVPTTYDSTAGDDDEDEDGQDESDGSEEGSDESSDSGSDSSE